MSFSFSSCRSSVHPSRVSIPPSVRLFLLFKDATIRTEGRKIQKMKPHVFVLFFFCLILQLHNVKGITTFEFFSFGFIFFLKKIRKEKILAVALCFCLDMIGRRHSMAIVYGFSLGSRQPR
jgi:hypothetical protein